MKLTTKLLTMKKGIFAALALAALGALFAPQMASAAEPEPTPPPQKVCEMCEYVCVPGPVRCIPHCWPVACPE
jgi:hypothetical protein